MSDPSAVDSLNQVLKTAPELGQSPGLAVGVAQQGGNVQQNAQATARGTQAISDGRAQQAVAQSTGGAGELSSALNWFSNHVAHPVVHAASEGITDVEHAVSPVLNTLNAPLQQVQHEYRYLHDVEARHGAGAAVLEGIGLAAGGAAGFAAGGYQGAVLGAEAAGEVEGRVFYGDSWQRTQNGNTYTDPNTHQTVSIGRDITSLLGLRSGTGGYKITSGLIDGIADIGLDPLAKGGQLVGEARSAEGAPRALGQLFGGTAPVNAEDIDRVYNQYGSVRRAFADIASKNAGEIAATPAYGSIARESDLLKKLGNANSADDVAQVLKGVYRTHEMAFSDKLPSLAITRVPFQALREAAENAGGVVGGIARGITRLPDAYDEVRGTFTNKEFDPSSSLDDGTSFVYKTARFTEDRNTAASIANEYANAPDLATKVRIYRNLQLSTLFNMAGFRGMGRDEFLDQFSDPDLQRSLGAGLDAALSGGMFGKGAVYGLDDEGNILSLVRDGDGWQYGAGITANQIGKLQGLDLNQARRAAASLAGSRDVIGKLGDIGYNAITQAIFKPLVLLTPSYALHISLAELIPNMLRAGVRNITRSAVVMNLAKFGIRSGDLEGQINDDRLFPENLGKLRITANHSLNARGLQPVMDFANKQVEAIQGLAWKLATAGRTVLPSRIDSALEDRLQLAARWIEYNDGHLVSPGLNSGHNYAGEVVREESTKTLLRRSYFDSPKRTGKTFGVLGVGNEQYTTAWQAWLKELANDGGTRVAAKHLLEEGRNGETDLDAASGRAADRVADYIRHEMPADERAKMLRSQEQFTSFGLPGTKFEDMERPPGMDAADEWARTIVANLRGATRGADRKMNVPLLNHVANGEWTTEQELNDIPTVSRPINVKGREAVPDGSSSVQRLANVGFHRVLNPMVNFLSRQPIAFQEFEHQWRLLAPKVENGIMDEDEAMTYAMNHTTNNVIRNIHNLTDRTQWTVTARNWMPFYFAQEQAYRRMGRLLAENPGAFRKYQLMISNIHDVGQVMGGQNGQGYFVMPGTGFMTSGVAQAASAIGLPVLGSSPVGMGWNLSSSSVIFPLSAGARPDFGPLVAIPTAAVAQFFPETLSPVLKSDLTAAATTILGPAGTEPIYEQMIPNTIVQRLMTAAFPQFNARSFNSTMMQVLATLDYEGKVPPPTAPAWQLQTFIDRVRNQTRIMYAVKAILGAVTPVSPEVTDQLYNNMNAELAADIQKQSSVSKGIQEFLAKNPDASPFTVFQSTNQQGVSIPSSVAAESWINNNLPIIRQYPSAALLLMPPNTDTTYNSSVYNEQIAQGLRTKWFPGGETPDGELGGYLAQLYIEAGNSIVLGKWYPQYEQQLQGLTGSDKYNAETAFQNTLAAYGKQNPIWYANWLQDPKSLQRTAAIQQMKSLLASPQAPKTGLANQTRQLLSAYDQYQNQLKVGTQDGFIGETQSQINQTWKDNLYATVAAHPEVSGIVSGLFLSLSDVKPPGTTSTSATPGQFTASNYRTAS